MDEVIKKYKIFAATPIWISIIHLISILFFQTNFSINDSNTYLGYGSFGFLFGTSQMLFSLVPTSVNAIKISVSISSIIISLILVFGSYFSFSKNQNFLYVGLCIYSVDYILSIVGQIIATNNKNISLNFVSYFFANLIHIVGIILITYSLYISSKIKDE